MAGTFDQLRLRLPQYHDLTLDAAGQELDQVAGQATDAMRETQAHGDVTSATRHSYSARRVGRGATGASQHATSVAAVEEFNAGHTATAPVSIAGPLGVIIDSATDYQVFLERNNAGQRAVLGPTIQLWARRFTKAVAEGARKAR